MSPIAEQFQKQWDNLYFKVKIEYSETYSFSKLKQINLETSEKLNLELVATSDEQIKSH